MIWIEEILFDVRHKHDLAGQIEPKIGKLFEQIRTQIRSDIKMVNEGLNLKNVATIEEEHATRISVSFCNEDFAILEYRPDLSEIHLLRDPSGPEIVYSLSIDKDPDDEDIDLLIVSNAGQLREPHQISMELLKAPIRASLQLD